MSHILTINEIDEERKEFYIDDKFLISVNHDCDGWSGMKKVEQALVSLAIELDIEVENTFNDEEDNQQ